MILSTHAIVGAALATFLPSHPAAAAVVGFTSHFAVDSIPHWDYPIRSAFVQSSPPRTIAFNLAFFRDILVIGCDALVGLTVAVALFQAHTPVGVVLIGAITAILPDPLQFAYALCPRGPMQALQRFHVWMHTEKRLDDCPLVGISSQFAFVATIVALTYCVHSWFA